MVSASNTDEFCSDCGQSIRVKRLSFHYIFLNRREKKSFRVNVWSSLSPGISMWWETNHLVLCKFICYLFFLFLTVVIIFIKIDFSMNILHTVMTFVCVVSGEFFVIGWWKIHLKFDIAYLIYIYNWSSDYNVTINCFKTIRII